MRIQFLMSDMASGNQNLISGSVTKDIQEMDQKHRSTFWVIHPLRERVISGTGVYGSAQETKVILFLFPQPR